MIKVTITEVARNLTDYINRVVYRGENFVLTRGKKPVAELRPIPTGWKIEDLEQMLKSLPRLTEEELEDFSRDLEEVRRQGNRERLNDPWESS
ncbi:MAG: hypothetical protein A2161_16470 [Candidatus Schekmanbacteria bacterium RBG_13_48_7]|uniref:Uncharacterized protein n=1 Tax=Candidatus Schekmanbacteria bacterium RBG_13_48_7 TaxID=1817878 RepID=A0A1F7RWD3_9BACT|nr:MAG: hypothetical protein A2161_16470 [Candidatus Schekmanbacteria bacterium RBG_13_48_7]